MPKTEPQRPSDSTPTDLITALESVIGPRPRVTPRHFTDREESLIDHEVAKRDPV